MPVLNDWWRRRKVRYADLRGGKEERVNMWVEVHYGDSYEPMK